MTRPLLFVGGAVRRRHGVGFAGFCLLAGSRWLVENAWPSRLPPLLGSGSHFLVGAVVALAFWLRSRQPLSNDWWRIGLAGMLLFGLPALCVAWAGSRAGPALFTLLPLFVVVGVAAVGSDGGSRVLMVPALVGAAGGLLVLPFALPTTGYGAVLFGVALMAVLSTAVGGIWLHWLMQRMAFTEGVAVVCLANAVVLGVAAGLLEGAPSRTGLADEGVRGLVIELPMTLLVLWLVRVVEPVRLAARALLVPLVTVVEGLVLLRPGVDPRMGIGVGLMTAGMSALLWWRPLEEEMGIGWSEKHGRSGPS